MVGPGPLEVGPPGSLDDEVYNLHKVHQIFRGNHRKLRPRSSLVCQSGMSQNANNRVQQKVTSAHRSLFLCGERSSRGDGPWLSLVTL